MADSPYKIPNTGAAVVKGNVNTQAKTGTVKTGEDLRTKKN